MQCLCMHQGHKDRRQGNKPSQIDLADVLYEAPCILGTPCSISCATLSSCSKRLQQMIHSVTTLVSVNNVYEIGSLVKGDWPCLAVVIVADFIWWKCKPYWPQHGSLHLLAALYLHHCDASAAVFVVAAKPSRQEPLASPQIRHTLSGILKRQVLNIKQLIVEIAGAPRCVKTTALQSELHQQQLASACTCLSGPKWQHTLILDLQYNSCGAKGIAQLSTVSWASVRELDFSQSHLDAAGVAALVKSSWANLSILDVSGNQLASAAVAQLIQRCWPQMQCLELSRKRLDNAAVTQYQQAQWPILCKLVLSRNPLVTAEIVATILDHWPLLVDIQLSHTRPSAALLSTLPHLQGHKLCWLELGCTRMPAQHFYNLDEANHLCLACLNLPSCGLGADAIAVLTTAAVPSLALPYPVRCWFPIPQQDYVWCSCSYLAGQH